MTHVVVGSACLNQTPLDWRGNSSRVQSAIDQAREAGVHFLCLPELCLSGYGCEDAFFAQNTCQQSLEMLSHLDTAGIVVAVGLPYRHGGALYNTVAVLADGAVLGLVAKHHLANSGIHYESRWFRSWPLGQRERVVLGEREVPFGDLVFEINGVRIGFEICEDAWHGERRALALQPFAVDAVFNPSASHFAFSKFAERVRLCCHGAALCQAVYVYANLLGNEAGRAIYDGGAIIAEPGGRAVCGPRFAFRDVVLTTHAVTVEKRARGDAEGREGVVSATVSLRSAPPVITAVTEPVTEAVTDATLQRKEEEFARAVALGLFDTVRKSASRGFVLSFSGGADSAAVACLVRLMVHLAVSELGMDGVKAKLPYWAALGTCSSEEELSPLFLTCVYQGTKNSTPVTRAAAAAVARELGVRYLEFEVQELVERYLALVSGGELVGGRTLDWEHDDLALQNIQARTRGPSVWLVANVLGALLLSTSNRSEAAVGYATMDGDTCGGLSPLGGIDKAFLLGWLRWLESEGVEGRWRVAALRQINNQQPTAELRPVECRQTDEGDLMPYAVLERIERLAVRDRLSPREVFEALAPEFEGVALKGWVERFFVLWSRSQWKRERYAPAFHLDDLSVDPKTWCRFPILSGGFEKELEELRNEEVCV